MKERREASILPDIWYASKQTLVNGIATENNFSGHFIVSVLEMD